MWVLASLSRFSLLIAVKFSPFIPLIPARFPMSGRFCFEGAFGAATAG